MQLQVPLAPVPDHSRAHGVVKHLSVSSTITVTGTTHMSSAAHSSEVRIRGFSLPPLPLPAHSHAHGVVKHVSTSSTNATMCVRVNWDTSASSLIWDLGAFPFVSSLWVRARVGNARQPWADNIPLSLEVQFSMCPCKPPLMTPSPPPSAVLSPHSNSLIPPPSLPHLIHSLTSLTSSPLTPSPLTLSPHSLTSPHSTSQSDL